MRKKPKLLALVCVLIAVIACINFSTILAHADTQDLDSELDNPVKGKMSEDDFPDPKDWAAYLEEHPEEATMLLDEGYPDEHMHVTPELAYTIKNLPSTRVIQQFFVDGEYLYATQRVAADGFEADLRLSRCLINEEEKTAVYQDHMILQNFGHGQTLEIYTHEEKQYLLVACKANTEYSNAWALQVGRIQYEAGKTISDYTKIPRFSDLMYANKDSSYFGSVKRVDAALSTDGSKLMIWAQDVNNNIQYSIYRADVMNAYLDMADLLTSKYITFKNDRLLKLACQTSFTQSGVEILLPNGSNQGIEVADDSSIYVAGANIGETPQIAVMTPQNGVYSCYSNLITLVHDDFDSQTEMEGIQLTHTGIYFGVVNHADQKQQYIYYFPYESIGQDAVHTDVTYANKKDATCTEDGYTGDKICNGCGELLDPGTVIPATGHTLDEGTVVKEPQIAINGTRRHTCETCGQTVNTEIPMTGITPAKGTTFVYAGVTYKITKKAANNTFTGGEVEYVKQNTAKTSASLPKVANNEGVSYSITSIGANAFKGSTKLQTLKIGANVKQIKQSAFEGCTNLTTVTGGAALTTVGIKAFKGCTSLKRITLNAKVNKIHKQAFYGCAKLTKMTIKTTTLTSSKIGASAFTGIPSSAQINVVNSKISAYKTLLRKKGLSSSAKVY